MKEIFDSKYANEFCISIFNSLYDRNLKIDEIIFLDEKDRFSLQDNLLKISETYQDIKLIIKISKNLTNSCRFITKNFKMILNIVKKDPNFKLRYNVFIPLCNVNEEDNINDIYKAIYDLVSIDDDEFKNLVDFEKLQSDLINFYNKKTLNEFTELGKVFNLLKMSNIIGNKELENYYENLHFKGINLINKKIMEIEDIINFIYKQDIYYYDRKYKNHNLRNPNIFRNIDITSNNKNYLINIKKLKENKIWELFKDSNIDIKVEFYNSFLDQIKIILDLKNIFDLFPVDIIEIDFFLLISYKLKEFIILIYKEKEENFENIFVILIKYYECYDNLNMNRKTLELNKFDYNFVSKFYFYILNKKEERILNILKSDIISFFSI